MNETFLPLRFMLNNIMLTKEMLERAKSLNQPMVFLKLDYSKANDRVNQSFLFQVIAHLGFPNKFIDMVHKLKLTFMGM